MAVSGVYEVFRDVAIRNLCFDSSAWLRGEVVFVYMCVTFRSFLGSDCTLFTFHLFCSFASSTTVRLDTDLLLSYICTRSVSQVIQQCIGSPLPD